MPVTNRSLSLRLALLATALTLSMGVVTSAWAGADEDKRAQDATRVLATIQQIPESGIPDKLLDEGRAIVVVPDALKIGLVIGGRRGHGLLSVKRPDGTWSSPSFIKLTGGSIGFQAGVQSADIVLVFRNDRSLESIVNGKVTLGAVTAMSDRCVHRRFPLSQAPTRLVDDQVICGYHGFTYGADGRCVAVPGQTRVPRTARLRSYPVVEQDSFVWVFIGDPDRADASRIPRAPWLDSPDYTTVAGMEPLAARFGLLVDNLLDLSHETYLHGGYIGTPEVASTPITTQVDEEAGVVSVSRHMDDAECPPFYARSTGLSGRIARWQDIEYTPPCLYTLHSRIAPVGSLPNPDGSDPKRSDPKRSDPKRSDPKRSDPKRSDPDAFHVEVVYAITPETEHTTHDFWAVARDFALDDQGVSDFLAEQNRTVVLQDVEALDVLEKVIATEADGYQELSINIDTGGLAARRMLAALVERGAALPARAGT